MDEFGGASLVSAWAIIGAVIIVSALLSGLIERSGLPQVAVFLALGAVLGPFGLGVLNISLNSPTLRVVAILSLALQLIQSCYVDCYAAGPFRMMPGTACNLKVV